MRFNNATSSSDRSKTPPGIAGVDCQQLLASIPAAIYTCDADGRITFYNEAAADLWGRKPDLGRDLWCGSWRIYHPDGSPMALDECPMAICLHEHRPVPGQEIIVERPDGIRRCILPHPRPIFGTHGELLGAVNLLVDITDRKQVEEALQEARESAEAASHAKDRFLAVLSHELRTPLTPVLMTVASMEVNPELPESLRGDIRMVRRNVELETRLIDDLLDLSRVTSGKLLLHLSSVNLNQALKDVCAICGNQLAEKDIHLSLKLDPRNDFVRADSGRLRQIFWNVIRNAIKFTPPGGIVCVRSSRAANDAVMVEVGDTGMGMEPATLNRIFDAFSQGSELITREFGGMGLGLAITRALVELQHGSIRAASDGPGKGSTFLMEFPRAASLDADAPASGSDTHWRDGYRLRLLLVEDHADTAETLSKLLRIDGYSVRVSRSAAEAMKFMETEPFDIVVSDLGLPDASGYDLMRRIRLHYPVKGIAMSGFGMEEDIRKSLESGFSEHLVKPIQLSQLEEAIQRVVGVTSH